MRANEFVTEVFQPGKTNWEWKFRGSEEAMAEFTVGDRKYFWQAFAHTRSNPTKWEVQFRLQRDYSKDPLELDLFGTTGTGNSAEVMSTAVDITREFLKEYGDKVLELTFNAKEDSRANLYLKMIKRLLPNWNLYKRMSKSDGMEFHLTNPIAYELNETINPDILHPKFKHQQEMGDYVLTAQATAEPSGRYVVKRGLLIRCYQGLVKPSLLIGEAYFIIHGTEGGNQWLESDNTHVGKDFRGQNISGMMYSYAKMLGNDVRPSTVQLKPGRDMWKAWKKSGAAQHLVK